MQIIKEGLFLGKGTRKHEVNLVLLFGREVLSR